MSVPFFALLTLALVLATSAATASPPASAPRGGPERRIELRATVPGAEPEVFIRPGTSTVLAFDGELATAQDGRPRVELERRSAFERAEFGATVVRLIPSGALKAGDRLRLTVRFQEGVIPLEAALVLVVSADPPDRLVEVYREPRPSELPPEAVRAAWEAVRRCQEALSRARVSPEGPEGLAGLLISRALDDGGVVTRTHS